MLYVPDGITAKYTVAAIELGSLDPAQFIYAALQQSVLLFIIQM